MKRVKVLLIVFALWTLIGVLSKPIFLLVHSDLMGEIGLGDWWQVVHHGLRLDFAVAGYFTALPTLLLLISFFFIKKEKTEKGIVEDGKDTIKKEVTEDRKEVTEGEKEVTEDGLGNGRERDGKKGDTKSRKAWLYCWRTILGVLAFAYSVAVISNIALYKYWGFPLDVTPLFYITTSPADAMASITIWQILIGCLSMIALTALIIYVFEKATNPRCLTHLASHKEQTREWVAKYKLDKVGEPILMVLLAGALIIPIRGGFSVAPNNTGSVYYSDNMRLNHASVNPVFSFLESATHQNDFGSRFRYMDDSEAQRVFDTMVYTQLEEQNKILAEKTNVLLIIMESFSRYIMADGGKVEGVTPCLDKLSKEGLYFTNFYANSFRTDRGLVSILSGFPAQPDMSIMKLTRKTSNLYSIARTLKQHGYATHYYYGGDANFTNMRSYLMQTGFESIVSEDDFPAGERTGKWGVNDGPVFDRALREISQEGSKQATQSIASRKPFFKVIQTSSSHEPFEVPYESGFTQPALNAFAYTDHCLGKFIEELKNTSAWQNTIVVMVPDHLGCYPESVDNYKLWRYQIPMVMVGGPISQPKRIDTVGMQVDLAATLLGMLGIDHSDFIYSKDILDEKAPHYAFLSCPNIFGMVNDENQLIFDYKAERIVVDEGPHKGANLDKAKAYIQKLYDDIAKR